MYMWACLENENVANKIISKVSRLAGGADLPTTMTQTKQKHVNCVVNLCNQISLHQARHETLQHELFTFFKRVENC